MGMMCARIVWRVESRPLAIIRHSRRRVWAILNFRWIVVRLGMLEYTDARSRNLACGYPPDASLILYQSTPAGRKYFIAQWFWTAERRILPSRRYPWPGS